MQLWNYASPWIIGFEGTCVTLMRSSLWQKMTLAKDILSLFYLQGCTYIQGIPEEWRRFRFSLITSVTIGVTYVERQVVPPTSILFVSSLSPTVKGAIIGVLPLPIVSRQLLKRGLEAKEDEANVQKSTVGTVTKIGAAVCADKRRRRLFLPCSYLIRRRWGARVVHMRSLSLVESLAFVLTVVKVEQKSKTFFHQVRCRFIQCITSIFHFYGAVRKKPAPLDALPSRRPPIGLQP